MKEVFSVFIGSLTSFHVVIVLLFTLSACSSVAPLSDSPTDSEAAPDSVSSDYSDLEELYWSRIESSRMSFVRADIDFMTDMISHHSQALIMSNLAPKNDASRAVQTLASRIHNAQQDEIATMQKWLRDRNQPVPKVHIDGLMLMVTIEDESGEMDHGLMDHGLMDHEAMDHDRMDHEAMDHESMGHQSGQNGDKESDGEMESTDHDMSGHSMNHHDMPGMLTQAQLEELAAAKGLEFDRKFLTFMIEHHLGAVFMVNELFGADGAANDNEIFDLASGIHAEQITEIERMKQMLEELDTE